MGPKKKRKNDLCILHHEPYGLVGFTPFSSIKGTIEDKYTCTKLLEIKSIRLNQPKESPERMEATCNLIPDSAEGLDSTSTGYHQQCYKRFTRHLDRIKKEASGENAGSTSRSPRKAPSSAASDVFPKECIFCEKSNKKVKHSTETLKYFVSWKHKTDAWTDIEQKVLAMGNIHLYRKVIDVDLFVKNAQYHYSCRNSFNTEYDNYEASEKRKKECGNNNQMKEAATHNIAFAKVIEFVENHVIEKKEVIHFSSLRLMYINAIEENGYSNPHYRGEKLLKRLQSHEINNNIVLSKIVDKGCVSFYLVYSKTLTVADAVADAYKLGSCNKNDDVALLLRGIICRAFKESQSLPWPPTPDDLDKSSPEDLMPTELKRFLNIILSGGAEVGEKCEKTKRLVLSIAQDLCRAVTDGEWKLPKHILICCTVRHLYRSKVLTTILNRLGHSESYDFGLKLEAAMAKALDEVSTYLTPQIIRGEGNEVFHLEWDNLNKITTNVHGSNVVNSTGGIMIQETKPGFDVGKERTMPLLDRVKTRSQKVETPATLPPLHLYTKVGPKFPDQAVFTPPENITLEYNTCLKEYKIWTICRMVGSNGTQPVPGFGGFGSATGTKPPKKSTIDYFTPIDQPFTEYSVVQELLQRSEAATAEVGQDYVLNTFDLGGCMKALPLIWQSPERYSKHVVMPGQFHTTMNYMGMVTGHKYKNSGYAEILQEANLVTSGCIKNVLSGKAYAKALFCLKTVSEAMERLVFERFVEEEDVQIGDPLTILNLVESCSRPHVAATLQDPSVINIMEKFGEFEEKVRKGHLGKTATFWFSFVEHSRLICMMLYSVKTNNLKLFHKCNGDMAELFFAFDGHNYSRYLVWLDVFLTNIDLSHPGAKELLEKGGIAVARSLIPGSLSAVDKTMEETFMKFAKSAGGLSGLFSIFGAYQRWCRTTSIRAQYYERTLEMCNLIDDEDCPKAGKHRELEGAEIRKSEDAVQRAMTAIKNFTNPFNILDKDHLYSLASGAPLSAEVERDLLRAEAVGKEAKESFIEDRFRNAASEESFFQPVKRKKLLTMEASNKKVALTSSAGKVIQYQEQSNLAFMLLVKSQLLDEPLDLVELMKYSLTPVPASLGTPDGFFAKTNKASVLHFLLEDAPEDVLYPKDAMYIQDGMALLHVLTNLPPTYGEICLQVLDQMVAKQNFIFSTDSYQAYSIKGQERLRRGSSPRFMIGGPATRKPPDFKNFLANDDNKKQLCQLLLKVWGSAKAESRLDKCQTAVVVCDGHVYKVAATNKQVTTQEIHHLYSDQEETGSRVVLYLKYAADQGFKSAVVRTPDTDIMVILLHHAHNIAIAIYLDIGSGKHRKVINITEMSKSLGSDYCTTMLGFYVFSGEDCTSAFKGKGKVGPLKKLLKSPKFHQSFRKLGDDWQINDDVSRDIEEFTCHMYSYPRETSVNTVRLKMLFKMVGDDAKLSTKSKVDLSRLPPCSNSLVPHLQRVNHRVCCYKRADQPIYERPQPYEAGQGWTKTGDVLEPLWSVGQILPSSLVDLLDETEVDVEDDEEDNEDTDIEEMLFEID